MKLNAIVVGLLLSVAVGTGALVSAQEAVGARMAVFINGDDIDSNQILFDYAAAMNLAAIEALDKAHPGEAVAFTLLIAKLPDPLAGWTGDDPSGAKIDMMGVSYSFAQRDYTKSEAEDSVSVIIYDTMSQQAGPWFGIWQGWGFSWETTEGYARSTTVFGYPAWETRDYDGKSGLLAIGLAVAPIPEGGFTIAFAVIALIAMAGSWRTVRNRTTAW